MIIDSRELSNNSVVQTDVCVIGAGIAGITLAREFDGKGVSVALLEGGGLEPEEMADLYRGEITGHPYHNLERSRTRGYGGSGNCWGGFCFPYDDFDLEERERIPNSGWPLKLSDLDNYIERAREVAQLNTLGFEFDAWKELSSELSENPFKEGAVELRILQKSRFGGGRLIVEPENYLDLVGQSDNVTLYHHANAVELKSEDAAGKEIKQVRVRTVTGVEYFVEAKVFILSSGGIENPRLLLASDNRKGIGNEHDLVGRYFMDHLSVRVGWFHPEQEHIRTRYFAHWHHIDAENIRIKSSAGVSRKVRGEKQLLRTFFELSLHNASRYGWASLMYIRRTLRHGGWPINWRFHLGCIWADRKALWKRLRGDRCDGAFSAFPLYASSEPAPNYDSRVLLSNKTDQLGMPVARLDWRISDVDLEHIDESVDLFNQETERAGLGKLVKDPIRSWPIYGHYHHIGTTRMSEDPAEGVVDPSCRVHSTSNLFVAGSSIFPTAGGGTATYMIMALSIRLADHISGLLETQEVPEAVNS